MIPGFCSTVPGAGTTFVRDLDILLPDGSFLTAPRKPLPEAEAQHSAPFGTTLSLLTTAMQILATGSLRVAPPRDR